MISPESYIETIKDLSYAELIKERDVLIRSIQRFEKMEKAGDRSGEEWSIMPSLEVLYQVEMGYLSRLCAYMSEKYNGEYVWGDKKL